MLATLEHERVWLDAHIREGDVYEASIFTGEFLGIALMARDFVPFVEPHWPNQRIKAVGVGLAESHLRVGAYNINYRMGVPTSIDLGIMEDNVPWDQHDHYDPILRTTSKDPLVWKPVVRNNVRWFYQLWATKNVIRDGKLDYRRWNPSVAYTGGWVTHPRGWVYHHDAEGKPVGPWVKAGCYLHKAIRGVINHDLLARRENAKTPEVAVEWAQAQARSFGVKDEWCDWDYTDKDLVFFRLEKQPTEPVSESNNWGYPVHNDGR